MFNIKQTAEILVPDKTGRASYAITAVGIVVMSGVIVALYTRLPMVVPIYYSLPWGEARLTTKIMLFVLPMIGLLVGMVNIALGKIAGKLSPLLPKMLSVGSAVVVIMLAMALWGIIQAVLIW